MKTEGWQKRFNAVISRYLSRPFVWGEFDCVVFAYQCASAVTERPIGVEVHMRFGDWRTCRQAFKAHKGKLGEAAKEFLGDHTATSFLGMGDIGIAEIEGQEAFVVCDGANFLGPAKEKGIQIIPRSAVKYGWIL